MSNTLGTIRGQMILDVKQTLAAYTAARGAHISTVTALHTGAGALTQVGAVMAGAGIAMGAGILYAVDAAAEFEKKLDYFGAVSASTQAEYDAIREKALQLGADTIYSANEIADSFIELGKAGVGAKDIIGGIGEAVANLGSAADIPLDTAAIIIMSAVQTFGLAAEDAVMVADKLAGAANASIVEVEDLGTSLKYAGGVASSLGIPFEDLNTAIALLGTYGIRGSTAGTSLRKIMLSLSGATPKATNALKELGIITEDGTNRFYDAAGSAKPLAEVFQILQDATSGLSDKQKVQYLNAIFQNRALASAIGLTTEGAAGFDKMAAAIDKTTAADVAGKRLNNLSGDIEILKGNLETLAITSGGTMQVFARDVVQGLTEVIQAFIDLPVSTQGFILKAIAIAAVVLTLLGFFGLFAGAILNIIALGIQLAPVFAAMKTAFLVVTGAIKAFSLALLANPIGLIIAAIALLVAGLVYFFTQTEVGKQAWSSFMTFLGEAWANIASLAITVWTAVSEFFSGLWTGISSFFTTAVSTIMDLFFNWTPLGIIISNWSGIVQFFVDTWTNIKLGVALFIASVVVFFQELPGKILAFLISLPARVGYIIGFMIGFIVRQFINLGNFIINDVPAMWNAMVAWFQALPMRLATIFLEVYTAVTTWLINLAIAALAKAIEIRDNIVNFLVNLPATVAAFFSDLYNRAVAKLTELAIMAVVKAVAIFNGIRTWIAQLPSMVLGFLISMVAFFQSKFNEAKAKVGQIAADIITNVRNTLTNLPSVVLGILDRVVSAIKGVARKAFNAVKDFASGLWEGFKDGLGINSPSYIEHAMWAITGVIADETDQLKKQVRVVQGLGNGITEMGQNMGFGFGAQLDRDLITLQDQLASAKGLEASFSMGARGTQAGVESTQAKTLAAMSKTLTELVESPRELHYDIIANNPVPEKTSESIPNAIRKATFISE